MPPQKPGRSKQDYPTPDDFFGAVEGRFGPMEWDLAANEGNSKCGKCFLGEEQNSLLCRWSALAHGKNFWLNPPYGYIEPWARKCALESERGARIFMLVPASVGSGWYMDYVEPYAYVFGLNPRLCFDGKASYPKDCVLCCYVNGFTGFKTWKWK